MASYDDWLESALRDLDTAALPPLEPHPVGYATRASRYRVGGPTLPHRPAVAVAAKDAPRPVAVALPPPPPPTDDESAAANKPISAPTETRSTRSGHDALSWAPMVPPAAGNRGLPTRLATDTQQSSNEHRIPLGEQEPRAKAIAVVEFKRGRRRKYEASPFTTCGTYVIVQGQRISDFDGTPDVGVDCGLVVQSATYTWDGMVAISELEGTDVAVAALPLELGCVLREARQDEMEVLLRAVPQMEQQALNLFRMRCVAHGYEGIRVHDCELQFDGRALTFFYEYDAPVDFAEVVAEMRRVYQARVEVENTNPHVAELRSLVARQSVNTA